MVRVLASSVVDHEFDSDGVKPKTIKLVSVTSPARHATLRRKSKDWLARIQDYVFR